MLPRTESITVMPMSDTRITFQEAKAWQTILTCKLNDGLFVPEEWRTAIEEMLRAGFVHMAHSLQRRYEHYLRSWKPSVGGSAN
ncbi:MAG: hypothetical protein SVT56_03770 [Chloroflexota bacterium]|nr:hypothetical protein [Chloroflexota bacterium]